MGFDYIVSAPLLPSRGFFFMSLDVEYLFLVDSSLFLSMVVQQLVVILVCS